MSAIAKRGTRETDRIERLLNSEFPSVEAYRYNSASIRVRIIDERFRGMAKPSREEKVLPLIRRLPEKTQADITMLVLLAPGEENASFLNLEFDNPSPSLL